MSVELPFVRRAAEASFRSRVAARRFLVRHPSLYWCAVATVLVAFGATVVRHADEVDAARASWGDTTTVLVATADAAPGGPLSVEPREVPAAVVPRDALVADRPDALTARQRIGRGEIVTGVDVASDGSGPTALVPEGWLAVPLVEATASGARVGDRVQLASAGFVLGTAVVVGRDDSVTLVAVPADLAASVPAAADADGVTLLLVP